MSTYRETLARLGELADNLEMDWYDAEVVSRFLVSEDEKQPLLTAEFIEACSPAVILALVAKAEEMRKALTSIKGIAYNAMSETGRYQEAMEAAGEQACEALAALDKEIE